MSIDIDAIEARANAATPGPWKDEMEVDPTDADIQFVKHSRQDVPALCAEVRELRAALGRLQGEVETIINTEPHEDVCLVTRGGDCTCWQARLQTALDGDK